MNAQVDVAVVSAFGRGNWLASECVSLGLKVALIDVSESLGRWTPEDWEGPFGFFHAESLKPSQIARLIEEDYHDAVDEGFTVWLKDGPLDLKGPLSFYLLERKGLRGPVEEYLLNFDTLERERLTELREEIGELGFRRTWLAHLAHQMASNVYEENAHGIGTGRPLPLFAPYFVRRVSRRGYEKSLEWLQSKNVQVHAKAKLKDLWVEGKSCAGVEIQGSWSGALKADHFIWALTSEETKRFPDRISEQLFPRGNITSLWSWIRFRLQLRKGLFMETLPVKFVMISDLGLPWTHTNMCIAQRTVNDQDLDLWVRLPTHHRFQRSYLEQTAQELLSLLENRIPDSQPKILDMPQDHLYEYEELGPPRFPVFSAEVLKQLQTREFKNLFYDGPERWENLDWTGQFRSQQLILNQIMEWKTKREKSQRGAT